MLVLSRRKNETIIINNETEVTVLGIIGNQVRIGVKAPKNISVHRQEVQENINNGVKK